MSTKDSEVKDEPASAQDGSLVAGTSIEKPAAEIIATDDITKSLSLDNSDSNIDADDKLDELSRLQLEMAELNKTEINLNDHSENMSTKSPDLVSAIKKDEDGIDLMKIENHSKKEFQLSMIDKKAMAHQNGQKIEESHPSCSNAETEILDHEDLIAVLKGEPEEIQNEPSGSKVNQLTKMESPKAEVVTSTDADLIYEGVTIEGEGEYQIMEIDDDFDEEPELGAGDASILESKASNASKSNANAKLTREEERAMAMEQIAGLNARGPRRRKQDIKPLQIETSELVSTLGADWSDDDEIGSGGTERSLLTKSTKSSKKESLLTSPQAVSQESKFPTGEQKPISELSGVSPKKRRRSVGTKVSNMIGLSHSHQVDKDAESSNQIEATNTTLQESTNTTGFKRTRTIKRRIIWDPDAPETSFSYANLVRNNAKDRQQSTSPVAPPKSRSVTPKEKRPKIELPVEKKAPKRAVTPSKAVAVKDSSTAVSADIGVNMELPTTSKQIRRSQTISPVANGSMTPGGGKKKKISEIDRLMRDEGAANMLNSLESGRGKVTDEDDDRPHRPLMRSRGAVVEKITKKETTSSPTAAAAVATTSSAKNKRVSKTKPSTSWDYVYQKKQLSEDSMIIRRRSNSSYSSTASQHRLSLDGPAGTTSKSNSKSADSSFADVGFDEAAIDNSTLKEPLSKSRSNLIEGNQSDENDANNDLVTLSGSTKTTVSMKQSIQGNATGSKSFEFAKPKDTKSNTKTSNRRTKAGSMAFDTTNAAETKKSVPKRTGPGRPPNSERQQNADNVNAQMSHSNENSPQATPVASDVHVRKTGKIAQIIFSTSAGPTSGAFTSQLMNKIVDALDNLASDENCNVVAMITNSPDFCQGVEFSNLATGSVEQRKSAAIVLATATKNYLKTLATFPKPLIVGIHGAIVGLGVTQLPLFDVVIASDKTTLETPYAKIGQVPEGYCFWQNLPSVRGATKTKLFWLGEKIHSTEASTSGLIYKLTTADRVNDDVFNTAKGMSNMSAVAYRSMKNVVIQSRLEAVISALDDEFDVITKHWTSNECYNRFKKFLEAKHF